MSKEKLHISTPGGGVAPSMYRIGVYEVSPTGALRVSDLGQRIIDREWDLYSLPTTEVFRIYDLFFPSRNAIMSQPSEKWFGLAVDWILSAEYPANIQLTAPSEGGPS